MNIKQNCPECNYEINVSYPDIIHSGFNDSGFLYCDRSGDLLTWGIYDKRYRELVGDVAPWDLNEEEKKVIESALIQCPCGGTFKFAALPRCPNCNSVLPMLQRDKIHWIRLKDHIDGEKKNIWKVESGH
jgi:uncharacterized protein with PIN domain